MGVNKAGIYIRLSRAAVSSTVVNRSLRICSSCARFASSSLWFPDPPFEVGVLCDVGVTRFSIGCVSMLPVDMETVSISIFGPSCQSRKRIIFQSPIIT